MRELLEGLSPASATRVPITRVRPPSTLQPGECYAALGRRAFRAPAVGSPTSVRVRPKRADRRRSRHVRLRRDATLLIPQVASMPRAAAAPIPCKPCTTATGAGFRCRNHGNAPTAPLFRVRRLMGTLARGGSSSWCCHILDTELSEWLQRQCRVARTVETASQAATFTGTHVVVVFHTVTHSLAAPPHRSRHWAVSRRVVGLSEDEAALRDQLARS